MERWWEYYNENHEPFGFPFRCATNENIAKLRAHLPPEVIGIREVEKPEDSK